MATLIKPDGIEQEVQPRNGTTFTLDELYALVECDTVQAVTLANGGTMYCDENAKLRQVWPPANLKATRLLLEAGGHPRDLVVGTVLIEPPRPEGFDED